MNSIRITIFGLIFMIYASEVVGQTKDATGYYGDFTNSNVAYVHKTPYGNYTDYFLPDKLIINEIEYHVLVREYTWGTTKIYVREDENNYYHYDPKNELESILIPKKVSVGHSWKEADKSWGYKITSIDGEFETPDKTYRDLIVVECNQLTGRDNLKADSYQLYFAKGLGNVGSFMAGKRASFLYEIKEITSSK